MRSIIFLTGASFVTAQLADISNAPACLITCLLPALSTTGCSLSDSACACTSYNQNKIRTEALPCLEQGCSKDDLTKARDALDSMCGAGGSQSLTTRPDTSTSAATDAPTSKSSPTTTTTPSTSANSSGSLPATSTSTSTTSGSVPPPSTGGSDSSEPSLSTTSSEARNETVLPTTTGPSNSGGGGGGGGGLSKGATAGIGVGAGLGGIAVFTGFAWIVYVQGKKAGKKSRDVDETTEPRSNPTFNSAPPLKQPVEAGGTPVAELP